MDPILEEKVCKYLEFRYEKCDEHVRALIDGNDSNTNNLLPSINRKREELEELEEITDMLADLNNDCWIDMTRCVKFFENELFYTELFIESIEKNIGNEMYKWATKEQLESAKEMHNTVLDTLTFLNHK